MDCLGENTVADLVDAMLAPDQRAAIEAHTARCDTCRRLVSELIRRSTTGHAFASVHHVAPARSPRARSARDSSQFDARELVDDAPIATGTPAHRRERRHLEPGTHVGRYVVRRQVGSGAMGTVFEAFDPELDRAIALKLLHPGTTAQRDRILREARALAKLSHPNVVAAHDVGELDGDLVLAMELVDGSDLRAWLTASPRSVDDILDVFRQAAAGLAAAHAAGLVHRDVKPANLVVGKNGRVRIVDFGLAAGPDGGTELVGTPAYMAPEVFDGHGADASSDQFALCVTLFEALYRDRPFVANFTDIVTEGAFDSAGTPNIASDRAPAASDAASAAPDAGPLPASRDSGPLPASRDSGRALRASRDSSRALRVPLVVPPYVRAALVRGLRADPAQRFGSLDALAAALVPPRRGRGARWIALGASVAVVAGVGVFVADHWASSETAAVPPCRDVGAGFAAVWSDARKDAIRARFVASRAPFAEAAWRAVDAGFAAFGTRWTAAQTDACEATRVRGVQSDQVLSLRAQCLDRALAEVDALAGVLDGADRTAVERAPAAIEALPTLAECANTQALLAPVPPPNERDAAVVGAIRGKLAHGKALRDAGKWRQARAVAAEAVAAAGAVAHDPTRAAALFLLGEAHEGSAAPREAEAALRDAYAAAERGKDDLLAARIATELVFVVGEQQQRFADGLEWAFHADTLVHRVGGDLEIEARLAGDIANIRYSQNDYPLARQLYDKAYELRVKATGARSTAAGRALFNVGRAAMGQGDNPAALQLTRQALAILEENLGANHPDIASALNGLGTIQFNQGKFADALATFDRALATALPLLSEEHLEVGRIHIDRGHALHALGREEEALAAYDHAAAIFDREGADRRLLAETLSGRGDAERALEKRADALASYRRALAIREEQFGKSSEECANSLESIAALDADAGRHADALVGFQAALAIRDKVDPPDYFEKAYPLAGIGESQTALGRAIDAVGPLRRAVELLAKYDGDPLTLAQTRFSLGVALWNAGGDKTEARALIDSAEAALTDDAASLERVRAWKKSH